MIKSFCHAGLQHFFETASKAGIQPAHASRLRIVLALLDQAVEIERDLCAPTLRLHRLRGDKSHLWSVTVRANWRITFEFRNGDAYIVDYLDYH
ncbi:type II toxin-antitoxin system RelE/ParE family toxin [Silvimonas iriomotensis]|uniref:Proteic killer suppression protein n=1 Tax=Silvimonas iriomotensis TaxID=449662 RepID=A0ABQ2P7D7_9NEIS|nr:type II toxin-antitoxin system RelE/ParE family toxin [Silvimonas iriomotensis]GGP20182.1 hypothetical protein GCM10010970_13950 [Silvimonas iriomotensis]